MVFSVLSVQAMSTEEVCFFESERRDCESFVVAVVFFFIYIYDQSSSISYLVYCDSLCVAFTGLEVETSLWSKHLRDQPKMPYHIQPLETVLYRLENLNTHFHTHLKK